MKISHRIRDEHGGEAEQATIAGMAEKSAEFAAHGHRVHLPLADRRTPVAMADAVIFKGVVGLIYRRHA